MITTSQWRSTKCAGAIRKPPLWMSSGVTHSLKKPSAQSTYWAVPPTMPPASTKPADRTLKRARRKIARVIRCEPELAKSPAWISTIARYAIPKLAPLPLNASGIASASTRNAAIAASRNTRRIGRSGGAAFVSHA